MEKILGLYNPLWMERFPKNLKLLICRYLIRSFVAGDDASRVVEAGEGDSPGC